MCGRYFLDSSIEALEIQFEAEFEPAARALLAPRYNIAPTTAVPVVVAAAGGGRLIVLHRWGLVPGWAKDPAMGARLANARAETAAAKPAFRNAFRRGRCILPADGFYEWQVGPDGTKQPYCFRAADGRPLGLAGLRERWEGPDGVLDTCTILTTAANELMAPIHDRMPVVLPPSAYAAWLDLSGGPAPGRQDRLQDLLAPCPASFLQAYPVHPRVGNVRNEGAGLAAPLEGGR
jgi:putative SOS response-associated peptidase YedK